MKEIKVGSLVSIKSAILDNKKNKINGLVLSKKKMYSNAVNDYFVYKILCGSKLHTITDSEYDVAINEIQCL
tara:strand:- start:1727 stop:1942 length:216 start_codon:yes stop_codon:yes gene_type:complete